MATVGNKTSLSNRTIFMYSARKENKKDIIDKESALGTNMSVGWSERMFLDHK